MSNNYPAPLIELNQNNIMRCPQCNLICSIDYKKDDFSKITFRCENGHYGTELLKDFFIKSKIHQLSEIECSECRLIQQNNNDNRVFQFCTQCLYFICPDCAYFHSSHKLINITKFDSICKIHCYNIKYYCYKCEKNICEYCKNSHLNHNLKDLSEYFLSENHKNKIKFRINEIENLLQKMEEMKDSLIKEFNNFMDDIHYKIQFLNDLLYSYEYYERYHNLNYYSINNLKNFSSNYIDFQVDLFKSINNEGNKLLIYIQKKSNEYLNHLKTCSKIIIKHKYLVNQIDILKDGKLISCSEDSINIYRKDSFDLYFSIKQQNESFESFSQLLKNKLIACFKNGKIKIINFNGNKYNIEQEINAHTDIVSEVMKLPSSVAFISVSHDKKMKLWESSYNSYFEMQSIEFQEYNSFCNIFKLPNSKFVTLSHRDEKLKFWEMNHNFNIVNITNINNIKCNPTHQNMCLISPQILCVVGKGFHLFDINLFQLIHKIGDNNIYSICLRENGYFLCGLIDDNFNSIIEYSYESGRILKINEREDAHKEKIVSIKECYNSSIISGGDCIKIWN